VEYGKIPTINLGKMLRVTPPLENIKILRSNGAKHIVVWAKNSSSSNAILIGKVKEHTTGLDLSNANVWLDISKPKVILVFSSPRKE
jgi:hypothetical protein